MARKVPPRQDRQKILDAETIQNGVALRKTLLKSKNSIELKIVDATKKGNIATAARLRDNLYKDLRREYVALQGNLDVWAAESVTSVAQDWTRLAVDDLPDLTYKDAWSVYSKKYLAAAIAVYTPSTIAGRVATTSGQLSPQLGGMLKADIDALRKVVIDTTRLQAATGMTAQEWRREAQARVMEETGGAWQFIDKSGRKWTANNYFNMLNRTLAANTARETYTSQMAEAGHDLATIEGGIPRNCCPFCLKWTGKIISISGKSTKYPSYSEAIEAGVFHPRCRHYLAVMFPGEEEDVAKQEEEMREDAEEKGFPETKKQVAPGDIPEKDQNAADDLKSLTETAKADPKDFKPTSETKRLRNELAASEAADRAGVTLPATPATPATPKAQAKKVADLEAKIASLEANTKKIEKKLAAEDRAADRTAPKATKATTPKVKLSRSEKGAIEDYTRDPFLSLNTKLRAGDKLSKGQSEFVGNIDKALDKMPDFKGDTFRQVRFGGRPDQMQEFLEDFKVGEDVSFKSYLSTSRSSFGTDLSNRDDVVLTIRGKNGKAIEKLSKNPGEREVLFGRNSKFKVVEKGKGKFGATTFVLEEV